MSNARATQDQTQAGPAGWAARLRRAIPFPTVWSLAIALVLIGEFYPLSPFPMYSNFDGDTFLVYVTDGEDKPLPMQTVFGIRAAFAKKVFQRERTNLRDAAGRDDFSDKTDRQAALTLLDYLLAHEKPGRLARRGVTTLRLHHRTLGLRNDRLVTRDRPLAERPVTERGDE